MHPGCARKGPAVDFESLVARVCENSMDFNRPEYGSSQRGRAENQALVEQATALQPSSAAGSSPWLWYVLPRSELKSQGMQYLAETGCSVLPCLCSNFGPNSAGVGLVRFHSTVHRNVTGDNSLCSFSLLRQPSCCPPQGGCSLRGAAASSLGFAGALERACG